MARDAAHVGGRVVPPLLGQQEALIHDVIGPCLPILMRKALVLWQRLDAGVAFTTTEKVGVVGGKPGHLANRLVDKFQLLARRDRHVHPPVGIGAHERGGRYRPGKPAKPGTSGAVKRVGRALILVRRTGHFHHRMLGRGALCRLCFRNLLHVLCGLPGALRRDIGPGLRFRHRGIALGHIAGCLISHVGLRCLNAPAAIVAGLNLSCRAAQCILRFRLSR